MATLIDTKLSDYKPTQELKTRKILSVNENGKSYNVKLFPAKQCTSYQIDNYIIKVGDKCDKLILVETNAKKNLWTEIFVELKGKNVAHAIKQLEATITNPIFEHNSIEKKLARIVAQSFPRNTGNSIMEKARNKFKKNYNCNLKGFSSTGTDNL